jgi:hypothetical protein
MIAATRDANALHDVTTVMSRGTLVVAHQNLRHKHPHPLIPHDPFHLQYILVAQDLFQKRVVLVLLASDLLRTCPLQDHLLEDAIRRPESQIVIEIIALVMPYLGKLVPTETAKLRNHEHPRPAHLIATSPSPPSHRQQALLRDLRFPHTIATTTLFSPLHPDHVAAEAG